MLEDLLKDIKFAFLFLLGAVAGLMVVVVALASLLVVKW